MATVSCWAAVAALFAAASVSQDRYGRCAATYSSALGPCQAPACTAASSVVNSSAVAVYSVLNAVHAPAAASNGPGPGPLLSNAECTSGGEAIQIGAGICPPSPVVGGRDQGRGARTGRAAILPVSA
ncbi:hypothetical protein C1Y40_05573 [Mycobacterium talmoniae]|uniref:Uncharacterized protein n=1 Tax=Mycobacterium talmoniae TaxID=1858794 RepID=A0A2S8BC86_9MYCO|nr:hypothetical protein C1Y40_05573 [Mycobacterium talmoniae]